MRVLFEVRGTDRYGMLDEAVDFIRNNFLHAEVGNLAPIIDSCMTVEPAPEQQFGHPILWVGKVDMCI